jgi:hypothetical protein
VIYGEAPSQVAERMLAWGVLRPPPQDSDSDGVEPGSSDES